MSIYLASEAMLDDSAGFCGPKDEPPRTPWDNVLAAAEIAAWPAGKPPGVRFEVAVHVALPPAESAVYFGANGTTGDDLPWPQAV